MKKLFVLCLAIWAMVAMVSVSEAGIYAAYYLNGDDQVIYSASSWDGYYHLVINYNNQDYSATATVLNPSGVPSSAYGYNYYWADFYATYFDFYGSYDGANWILIGTYY